MGSRFRGEATRYQIFLALLLVYVSIIDAHTDKGWVRAPPGRFPSIVRIKAANSSCIGCLVHPHYVLTTATCLAAVGANPIVVISPQGLHDNPVQDGVQEIKAAEAVLHPKWAGDNAYDVALLRLPSRVNHPTPIPAAPKATLYPSLNVYSFKLGATLQQAEFHVVPNVLCPDRSDADGGSFCIMSKEAELPSDSAGTPILILDDPPNPAASADAVAHGSPKLDLLLGVVSGQVTNAAPGSGTPCWPVTTAQEWILNITRREEPLVECRFWSRLCASLNVAERLAVGLQFVELQQVEQPQNWLLPIIGLATILLWKLLRFAAS